MENILEVYGDYVFNTNNHKIIKLPKEMIDVIKEEEFNIDLINKLKRIYKSNSQYDKWLESFLYSEPIYKHQEDNNSCDMLQLVISNACNMKCKYCYANEGTYNNEKKLMDLDIAKKGIDLFFDKYENINSISFFGGEPLINKKVLIEICDYINENYVGRFEDINFMSNLFYLSDDIIKVIKKYNIKVATSLDGDYIINDKNRIDKKGNGTYYKVNENIKKLRSLTGQPIKIESTVYADSSDEFNKIVIDLMEKFSKDYGINFLIVNNIQNFNNKKESVKIFDIDLKSEIKSCIENKIVTDELIEFYYFMIGSKAEYRFEAGVNRFSIFPDGNIVPCQLYGVIKENKFILGNIKDIKTLENPIFDEKVKMMKDFNYKYSILECKNCVSKDMCTYCISANVNQIDYTTPVKSVCNRKVNQYYNYIDTLIYLNKNIDILKRFVYTVKEILVKEY